MNMTLFVIIVPEKQFFRAYSKEISKYRLMAAKGLSNLSF